MRALFSPSYPASSNPIFELFLARSCEVWAIAPISILGYIYVTRLNYGHKRKRNEAKDGLARCSMPLTLQETVNPNIPASSSLVLIFYQLELAHTHTHTQEDSSSFFPWTTSILFSSSDFYHFDSPSILLLTKPESPLGSLVTLSSLELTSGWSNLRCLWAHTRHHSRSDCSRIFVSDRVRMEVEDMAPEI